ncbi:venom acid phosphatase Acph-1-like [Photinus pyralis]|nr:venom acid phosphatase Acph-1-like [Photinus pyralis]
MEKVAVMLSLGLILAILTRETFTLEGDTLQMVFTVFRHGHRANEILTAYPKDPHKNFDYAPYGWGQLTNEGKMREYNLGKMLHARYGEFLGMYTPEVVDALSTNYNRTKMSLELVLAGLFPPESPLDWNKELNWQPIPYNYLTGTDNRMGFPTKCSKRSHLVADYENSPEGQLDLRPYKKWFNYISKNTGLHVRGLTDLYILYFGLSVQEEWGLKLPEWVKPVYPELLKEGAIDLYVLWSRTPEINKLGGFNLKTILDAAKQKIDGTLNPPDRKIMLFSAHEINVAGMLNSLNAFYRHIPPYGACVILELHKIDEQYGFKLFYETHNGEPPAKLIVPGCDHFCPIDQFQELLKENIPENYDICQNDIYTSIGFLG